MARFLASCLLVLSAPAYAGAQTLYVRADAPAGGDGATWATAMPFLGDALIAAGTGDQIFVAEGVYRPDDGSFRNPGDREETFKLVEGVSVFGGFVGTEHDPLLRQGSALATILSGDLAEDDQISFTNRDDNSYHVVRGRGVTSATVLDGFTITGGNADGGSTQPVGGGIYNAAACSPTVRGCIIRDNRASDSGGGVANRLASSPIFEDCVIEDNYAQMDGGGWYDYQDCSPVLWEVRFTRNESGANGGGAYSLSNCTPSFTECVFEDNYTAADGGAYRNAFSSLPMFDECVFIGNVAGDQGGAIDNDGMVYVLRRCEFLSNSSAQEGGAVQTNADLSLVACTFEGNQSGSNGGAIVCTELSATISVLRCLLRANDAAQTGGALHLTANLLMENSALTGNTAGADGGAVCLSSADLSAEISNSDFINNSSGDRGGACFFEGVGQRTLSECVLAMNESDRGGALYHGESALLLERCEFNSNRGLERGGAIFLTNAIAGATIRQCAFTSNFADTFGGALYVTNNSSPLVQRTVFRTNTCAVHGGAIFNTTSEAAGGTNLSRYENCEFISNSAQEDAGAVFNSTSVLGGDSRPVFFGCLWLANTAGKSGGAFYNTSFEGISRPVIVGCDFRGNLAMDGGAIFGTTPSSSSFSFSRPQIQNSVFSGNRAQGRGGAVYLWNRGQAPANTDAVVTGCTFSANVSGPTGGGIHVRNTGNGTANVTLDNSIMWSNRALAGPNADWQVSTDGGAILAAHDVIEGGYPGLVILQINPQFLDALGPDGAAGTRDDDLHLQTLSPVVDTGDPSLLPLDLGDADNDGQTQEVLSVDLHSRPRSFNFPGTNGGNGIVDPGAYEMQDCDGTMVSDTVEILSALTLDCDEDFVPDFCALPVVSGGICTSNCVADCDINGIPDPCEEDCDENGELDLCQVLADPAQDCNGDGIPDVCSPFSGGGGDCDQNGVTDLCDIAAGAPDCDMDGFPDLCALAYGIAVDCNENGIPDECDIASGLATDCNGDGRLDECYDLVPFSVLDCNGNGIFDVCDIASGVLADVDGNGFPDACFGMVASGGGLTPVTGRNAPVRIPR